jgi:hypothetical protein
MHPGSGTLAATLAQGLRQLADRGELAIDNPLPTASDFSWLVISTPQKMVMFGAAGTFTTAGVEEFVTSAVKVFLAACQPRGR